MAAFLHDDPEAVDRESCDEPGKSAPSVDGGAGHGADHEHEPANVEHELHGQSVPPSGRGPVGAVSARKTLTRPPSASERLAGTKAAETAFLRTRLLAPTSTVTVGKSPHSVLSADFNGDGTLDLAVANMGGNSVSVLLGTGSGSFPVASTFAVGPNPVSITSADFKR